MSYNAMPPLVGGKPALAGGNRTTPAVIPKPCSKTMMSRWKRRSAGSHFAIDAYRLQPGDRVLAVGGGWGSFMEHAGQCGIQVTSLTISRQSEASLTDLIERRELPCQVVNQDFLAYTSPDPYDALVILGVMEHLPDYLAVLRQFLRLLKPGGRVYLDASAHRDKYSKPTFIARYIFPADHSFLCLHDFLAAVAKGGMDVLAVHNDRHSYFLTCKAWAERKCSGFLRPPPV